jgi:isopentenyl phosphate kinase
MSITQRSRPDRARWYARPRSSSAGPIIIKIGGSVITDKSARNAPKLEKISEIAKAISSLSGKFVLIHGAGSFAHPVVDEHRLQDGLSSGDQLRGFMEAKYWLLELQRIVLGEFQRHGVPVSPIMPSSCIVASGGRISSFNLAPIRKFMELGLIPLLHGDLVPDAEKGLSIVSGDQLAMYLAKRMGAKMVIFGCDVDGLFDGDPKEEPDARLIPLVTPSNYREALRAAGGSRASDVTGGMRGKVLESIRLARGGIEVLILNLNRPGDLERAIRGGPLVCTRFVPARAA